MPSVIQAFEKLEALGKELNVKQHYFVWCPPDHVAYALLETDSIGAVSRYVFSIPIRQEVKVIPVEHLHDTVAFAKIMMEEAKKK